MEDFIVAPIVLTVGLAIHFVVLRGFEPGEQRLLNASFIAHIFSAFAQILVYAYYYEGGDMMNYRDLGIPVAEALRYDFEGIFPETVKMLLQRVDAHLPFETLGGGSTGSMLMIASYLMFLLANSFYGASLVIAVLSYVSKTFIYRAFAPEFQPDQRRAVMIGVMLMPTAIFWTCALLKEPVVMIALGPLFLGVRSVIQGRNFRGALLVALGATGVALIKAYVLLAFAGAAAVWVIWARVVRGRGSMAVKPGYLLLGLVGGMLLFTVAERFLTKRVEGGLAASMASQRRVSSHVEGDSNYLLEGDAQLEGGDETTLTRELLLTPLALVTALFRPFLFEVRKPLQAVNAIETTWVLWATIAVFRRNRVVGLVNKVTASPALMFCLVFTLVLAIGTALSTSNLGTLSRYRAPMMPFFAILLLTLLPKPQTAAANSLELQPT